MTNVKTHFNIHMKCLKYIPADEILIHSSVEDQLKDGFERKNKGPLVHIANTFYTLSEDRIRDSYTLLRKWK